MVDKIHRIKTTSRKCHYILESDPRWKVIATRTNNVRRCGFEVYQNETLQYTLRQVSLLKQIIGNIPGAFLFFENPFTFEKEGVPCGTSKRYIATFSEMGKWDFSFDNHLFHVALQPEGRHTLSVDGQEVAQYQHIAKWHHDHYICYEIEFSEEDPPRPDILLLLGAFVEVYVYMDRDKFGLI